MRDLARLAIAAFGRPGEGSGVIGVDVQRIRRALNLRTEPQPDYPTDDPRHDGLPRDAIRRFEQILRRELERRQIERTQQLPPSRPLNELDRALPSGPLADLAAVHRVVMALKRRLKTQGQETARPQAPRVGRHPPHDARVAGVRRRAGQPEDEAGSPAAPGAVRAVRRQHQRHQRQRLLPVGPARAARLVSQDALVRVHRAHQRGHRHFERERDFRAVSAAISRNAGVADISGYTDYGRVWTEFAAEVEDDLHPRATVIVLGDARTNGRDPKAEVFGQISAKAGRTFWLNPEPRLYWNYGDSVISAYERYCHAFECWTTRQLEDFVEALANPAVH